MKRLIPLVALALLGVPMFYALFVASVLAQPAAPTTSTTVNFGELLAPWLPALTAAVAGLFLTVLAILTAALKRWTGVEIEKAHMQTLQAAIENAAGKMVMKLGEKMKTARFDTKSDVIKLGVEYVNKAASDSVREFGLTSDDVAEKIIAKIGVITAADPTATPIDVSKS